MRTIKSIFIEIAGAMSGGLYGAAVGVAKTFAPKLIKITLIASVVLILLPVVVISSLPSVLFGWSMVPAQDLKDRKEYATVMETCYNQVSTYRQEVVDEIVEENSSGADEVVINDDNSPMDVYWFISIDGASHKQDVYNLNQAEIKRLIKDSLDVSVAKTTVKQSDDSSKTVVTITITTKSPEEIMASHGLDEEHKNWAQLLYNTTTSPQALSESDSDYISGSGVDYSGVTFKNGETDVVYYNQLDSRWANMLYGRAGTIGKEGCGAGRAGNGQMLVDALSSGKLVISIMNPGHFTKSGHFIVLRGVTESGKILVADPASKSRSEQECDLSTILREARPDAGAGGPFWILSSK